MKTKLWIILIAVVAVICLGLSLWLLRDTDAKAVEIWSDDKLVQTLSLAVDQEVEIVSKNGANTVTVREGKVSVTYADCPDKYCMERGWCSGGAQIVCLPNRLVLKFVGETQIDGVAG